MIEQGRIRGSCVTGRPGVAFPVTMRSTYAATSGVATVGEREQGIAHGIAGDAGLHGLDEPVDLLAEVG